MKSYHNDNGYGRTQATYSIDNMMDWAYITIMKTIVLVISTVMLIVAIPLLSAAERTGEQVYKAKCLACHNSGAGGAPKIGDAAAWKALSKKGVEGLAATVKKGAGIMPPGGGCGDCSEAEIKAAVKYMMDSSK